MVNRFFFARLCKTFVAVEFFVALALPSQAQVSPSLLANGAPAVNAAAVSRASASAPAEKLKIAGVPNAGKISDSLFRGAQPSPQGLAELKKLGVTTIVDLRGNRGPVAQERAAAEALGLRFVDIPVNGWAAPTNSQVAQFLKLFQDDSQQKIFVHCYYGEDRTGVMIATYRIAKESWTADQAIAEMYSFGFHYRWHPSMKTYVRAFAQTFSSEPAFASLRPAPAPR